MPNPMHGPPPPCEHKYKSWKKDWIGAEDGRSYPKGEVYYYYCERCGEEISALFMFPKAKK